MLNKLFESVFIAVLCHFSVTMQDSNVLFVLKFTWFDKNSRYRIFFHFFLVSGGTSTDFLFAVRGFSTGVMTVWIQTAPAVHVCWVEIEYPDPGSAQYSYTWCTFLYVSSGLWSRHCVQAQTPLQVLVMFCSNNIWSYQHKPGWFCSWRCLTLVFRSDTWDDIRLNDNVVCQQMILETWLLLGLHLNPPCGLINSIKMFKNTCKYCGWTYLLQILYDIQIITQHALQSVITEDYCWILLWNDAK